jgi:exonuclease SbcC
VEAVEVAEVALRVVEAEHAAHTLAGSLAVGRDCPVCLRPVERVPDHPTPPGLEEAARRLERAREGLVEAEGRNAAAATRLASCRATLAQVDDDLATIETVLEGRPDATAAERLRLEHTRAAEAAAEARAGERTRRAALDEARRLLDHRRIEEASARKRFTAERDRLADLGPPEPGQDDLAEDWRAFAVWAGEAARERRITLTSLETAAAGLVERAAAAHHDLTVRIEAAGVSVGGEPLEGVVRAAAEARQRVEAIRADRARAETTSQRLAVVRRAGEVARAMAGHLSARGFESWLMEEAMVALVDGANRLLAELCGEAYSLRADTREFQVVDHRNADEIRGVKTLSGGETFLVSLALALSLAEHIGSHAPAGIARLESIFLDEGFGTLDAESLETVAAVIQELGASGRTVGIVTHVKELAEMVPVRFEVTRNPSGSVVRRVET